MKQLFLLLFVATFLFSCENKEEFLQEKTNLENNEVFSFEYNGILYSSDYILDEDEVMIITDAKVQGLLVDLYEKPNLCTLHTYDGKTIFYDSYEDFLASREIEEDELFSDMTRANVTGSASAYFFENTDFKGRSVSLFTNGVNQYPDLKQQNMDKMISSLHVMNNSNMRSIYVMLFAKPNFAGKGELIESREPRFEIKNLKKLKVSGTGFLGIGTKNWNNRISSVRLSFYK